MTENIIQAGTRHLSDVIDINRELTEKALHMRCLSYLSQVKSQLLTATIFEIDHSKKSLHHMNQELARQRENIVQQRDELARQMQQKEVLEQELREANKKLAEKNAELSRFNKLFVDREFRIKGLKERLEAAEEENRRLKQLLANA